MKEIRVDTEIHAPAERVWQILTDTAKFPEWNPFVRRLSGELKQGAQLEVFIQPSGGRGLTFRPTLLAVEPNHQLRWIGHLIVPGLFDGEHSWTLEPLGPDRVRFIHREVFNGLLVPLFNLTDTERGFREMNAALQARAEQSTASKQGAST